MLVIYTSSLRQKRHVEHPQAARYHQMVSRAVLSVSRRRCIRLGSLWRQVASREKVNRGAGTRDKGGKEIRRGQWDEVWGIGGVCVTLGWEVRAGWVGAGGLSVGISERGGRRDAQSDWCVLIILVSPRKYGGEREVNNKLSSPGWQSFSARNIG